MSQVEQAFDDEFGETVTVTPYTKSEYFSGLQTDAAYTLQAIVDDDGQDVSATGTRHKGKVDATIAAGNIVISVSLDQLSSKPVPKQNWRISRVRNEVTISYAIKSTRKDGLSRLHIFVERDINR